MWLLHALSNFEHCCSSFGNHAERNCTEIETQDFFFSEGTSGDVSSGTWLQAASTVKSDSTPELNEVGQGLAQSKSRMHIPVSLGNPMAFYLISNQSPQVHGDTASQVQDSIELHEVFPAYQVPFEWQLYPAAFQPFSCLNNFVFHLSFKIFIEYIVRKGVINRPSGNKESVAQRCSKTCPRWLNFGNCTAQSK